MTAASRRGAARAASRSPAGEDSPAAATDRSGGCATRRSVTVGSARCCNTRGFVGVKGFVSLLRSVLKVPATNYMSSNQPLMVTFRVVERGRNGGCVTRRSVTVRSARCCNTLGFVGVK